MNGDFNYPYDIAIYSNEIFSNLYFSFSIYFISLFFLIYYCSDFNPFLINNPLYLEKISLCFSAHELRAYDYFYISDLMPYIL